MRRLNPLGVAWAVAATVAAPAVRLLLRLLAARGKEVRGRLAERRGIDPTPRPAGGWSGCTPPASARPCRSCRCCRSSPRARDDTVDHRDGDVGGYADPAAGTGAGRTCAASLRAARRAAPGPRASSITGGRMWRASSRASCGPTCYGLPRAWDPDHADQRPAVGPQPGTVAACAGLARQMLGGFTQVQPRSATDAERLRALGCCCGRPAISSSPRRRCRQTQAEVRRLQKTWPAGRSGSPRAPIRARRTLSLRPIGSWQRIMLDC